MPKPKELQRFPLTSHQRIGEAPNGAQHPAWMVFGKCPEHPHWYRMNTAANKTSPGTALPASAGVLLGFQGKCQLKRQQMPSSLTLPSSLPQRSCQGFACSLARALLLTCCFIQYKINELITHLCCSFYFQHSRDKIMSVDPYHLSWLSSVVKWCCVRWKLGSAWDKLSTSP